MANTKRNRRKADSQQQTEVEATALLNSFERRDASLKEIFESFSKEQKALVARNFKALKSASLMLKTIKRKDPGLAKRYEQQLWRQAVEAVLRPKQPIFRPWKLVPDDTKL